MLDHLELVQRLFPVEQANVLRLRGREPTHRPAQVYEVRLHRVDEWVHPDLRRHPVPLSSVTGGAGGHAVRPLVRPASGEWDEVIAGERLAGLELSRRAPAVLTAVAVAREEER